MYDLSLEHMLLPSEEVIESRKGTDLSFQACADQIFSYLGTTENNKTFLLNHIFRSLDDNAQQKIKQALAIDFKYYFFQNLTRKAYTRKITGGAKEGKFRISNPMEMSLASFADDIFADRIYVINDKYPQNEEYQGTQEKQKRGRKSKKKQQLDEGILASFKYFLLHLPNKIKDLELNFIEQEYVEPNEVNGKPKLKEKVRSYSYSSLSKDFLLYCYIFFDNLPSLKRANNNIENNGDIVNFLNLNRDMSAFKLSQSDAVDESDDGLLLLYDIEQHFMPYCMAVIYEKMPNISDNLLAHIKALAAPMTRLTFVKLLAEYIEANNGKQIEIPDNNVSIQYYPYLPGETLKINMDNIADMMGNFILSFSGSFSYQFSASVENAKKLSMQHFKDEINVEVCNYFGEIHKGLTNKGYQAFYKKKYYNVANVSDQFYSFHETMLNDISRIDKKRKRYRRPRK